MIELKCAQCDQTLEATDELAGQVINCPECNCELSVPDPNKSVTNDITWQSNPSWLNYLVPLSAGCLLLFVAIHGSTTKPMQSPGLPIPDATEITAILFGFFGVLFVARAILDHNARRYFITKEYLMTQSGILSRNTNEIAVKDIRSINMTQGVLERAFGLGSIQVSSAGAEGMDVKFRCVKTPEQVRDMVRALKKDIDVV